jgi:hypothetical protein
MKYKGLLENRNPIIDYLNMILKFNTILDLTNTKNNLPVKTKKISNKNYRIYHG